MSNRSSNEVLAEQNISIHTYTGSEEEFDIVLDCTNQASMSTDSSDKGYDKQTLKKLIKDGYKGPYFIIKKGNEILGSVAISTSTIGYDKKYKVSAINDFAILKKHQGKGLGKQALLAIIDYIKSSKKVKNIGLGVSKTNTKALSLYKSVGFKIICECNFGTDENICYIFDLYENGDYSWTDKSAEKTTYHSFTNGKELFEYLMKMYKLSSIKFFISSS